MPESKRVALSLRVSEHARDALKARAAREGHRYPLAFAAALLERAIDAPTSSGAGPDWLSDVRGVARVFGGSVAVDGDRVTLILEPKTGATAVEWLQGRMVANHPPPAGVVFAVKVAV